jgi:hypothetical protein
MRHERDYLAQLSTQGLDIAVIDDTDPQAAEAATLAAMQAGAEVIYQARLGRRAADQRFGGIADFLRKRPGPSRLGAYHYEPWDTKLARKAKPYFVIQLCCYADMLHPLQDRLADHIHIVLGATTTAGHADVHSLRTEDYYYYYLALKCAFLDFHRRFDVRQIPDPSLSTEHDTLARLKQQAQLQQQSLERDCPLYEVLPHAEGVARGLALLPPASSGDVFFDLEGLPLIEEGGWNIHGGPAARSPGRQSRSPSMCSTATGGRTMCSKNSKPLKRLLIGSMAAGKRTRRCISTTTGIMKSPLCAASWGALAAVSTKGTRCYVTGCSSTSMPWCAMVCALVSPAIR